MSFYYYGQEESDTLKVNSDSVCDCRIAVPSAFSPNGDGLNDVFRPVIAPDCVVRNYVITVYNRWGQLVYTGTQTQAGWDGRIKDRPAEVGTYMYSLKLRAGYKTKEYFQKGDLLLVR